MKTVRILKCFFIIVFFIIIGIYLYSSVIRLFVYRNNARELIISIEEYWSKKGRYPSEIEFYNFIKKENNAPYYKCIDNNKYIIYYGLGFDNTYVYSSEEKKWREVNN